MIIQMAMTQTVMVLAVRTGMLGVNVGKYKPHLDEGLLTIGLMFSYAQSET